MRLCLKCRRLNVAGAHFCAFGCGAFGGARCSNGHLVPMLAVPRVCAFCRSTDIVPAVPTIRLTLLTRLTAWGLALVILHVGFLNLGGLALSAYSLVAWTLGRGIMSLLWNLLTLAFLLKVLVWGVGILSPDAAKSLSFLDRLLPELLKALTRGLVSLGRLFLWLAEGRPLKASKKPSKAKEQG